MTTKRSKSILSAVILAAAYSLVGRELLGAPLKLSVAIGVQSVSSDTELPVILTLTNTSGIPIVIPGIDHANQLLYFGLFVTDSSGTTIFTIPPPDDTPQKIATNTIPLQPGESLTVTEILNSGGVGYYKYLNPADPGSVVPVSGALTVVGGFIVDASNRPTGGDPSVFIGTIKSTDTAPPQVIKVVLKETGDLSADGSVDCVDYALALAAFGKNAEETGFDSRADLNDDGFVDVRDEALVIQKFTAPGLVCRGLITFQHARADIDNSLQTGLIDNAGVANSLSQKLQAAQNATGPAQNNLLKAFKNELNAQAGKHVKAPAALVLSFDANSL
jgi:hypothetical protein